MKITINLLLAGAMALLFSSMASAQVPYTVPYGELIYSNGFVSQPTPTVTILNSAPQLANNLINGNYTGGTNTAIWLETTNDANFLTEGGTIDGHEGTALLPFTPVPGNVYIINWVFDSGQTFGGASANAELGFAQAYPGAGTNADGTRIQDSAVSGWDWLFDRTTVDIMYRGAGATVAGPTENLMPGVGLYTNQIVLSAFGVQWIGQGFINGVQIGTNVYYGTNTFGIGTATNPLPIIHYLALGGQALGAVTKLSYTNSLTLSMVQVPFIDRQPASGSANQNGSYTVTAGVMAPASGGPLTYQWYNNGTPVGSAGTISTITATNVAALTLNPVTTVEAGTNYYVTVANSYGSITSSPASLVVFSSPQFTSATPITYTNLGSTNLMFLYGGTNTGATAYYGSSPTFSVSALGASPIGYFWLTNGVAMGGATNTTFAITNAQWNSPTNIVCVASNFVGTATNIWSATYLPTPQAPFPQAVLAAGPVGYWRLNDTIVDGPDNGNGDNGYVCNDYQSGNNGIYTNLLLGNAGYNPTTDPSESSALFDYNLTPSAAYSIGTNVDFSAETNAEFTVAVWANGDGQIQTTHAGIVSKGYWTQEEFALDNNAGHNLEFLVQNGSSAYPADSSYQLGSDSNWHYIVGVCDEANGLISLYVDGELVGTTNIPAGSGVFNASRDPIQIGAQGNSLTTLNYQYVGYLNDVATYNYALTPSNVATSFETVGGTIPPYLLAPLPPANALVLGNTNLTIPASVFGEPPFGYYWITNGNTANVLGSGSSTTLAPLNATLTTAATTNWWGYQLELVVTNAYGSTNWFVNVTAPLPPPPAPIVIGYTNGILYSNVFSSGIEHVSVNGFPATAANFLVGGTNSTWVCTLTNNALSQFGTVYLDGTIGTNASVALLPFTPEPGFIYTLTASLNQTVTPASWVCLGFSEYDTQVSSGTARFDDNPPNGYAWLYIGSPNVDAIFETGPSGSSGPDGTGASGFPGPSQSTFQIILNTLTNNAWTAAAYDANGNGIMTNVYSSNPPIHYFGMGENNLAGPNGTAGTTWNFITLTEASPNGYPPYLLTAPPTSSILLTNATITLSASGIGTGPWGYYWINNSTVLTSGTTNNTAPNNANLSIPSTSLSAGSLELVLTNALGTNITSITLVSPVNANPTNIVATVTNNNLYLTWPVDHTGWQLQAQTNSVGKGISTNWANYNPSTGTNQVVIPVNLTNGTVFYRLTY